MCCRGRGGFCCGVKEIDARAIWGLGFAKFATTDLPK